MIAYTILGIPLYNELWYNIPPNPILLIKAPTLISLLYNSDVWSFANGAQVSGTTSDLKRIHVPRDSKAP